MRFVQLIFSPTGGVKRAAGLLSAPMAEQPDIIDLSLPLNGSGSTETLRFTLSFDMDGIKDLLKRR